MNAVLNEALVTGVDPNVSDSFLINGQPGDLHPCSNQVQSLTSHFKKLYTNSFS